MADDNVSKTGKWVDTKTGKVVASEPEEGRLLVAPGQEITPDVRAGIDAAERAAKGEDAPVETAVSTQSTRKVK